MRYSTEQDFKKILFREADQDVAMNIHDSGLKNKE